MFMLTKQNAKEFQRAMAVAMTGAEGKAYFGRVVSAMHRAASGRQQQAIIETVQAAKMTFCLRELPNGALVSAFEV